MNAQTPIEKAFENPNDFLSHITRINFFKPNFVEVSTLPEADPDYCDIIRDCYPDDKLGDTILYLGVTQTWKDDPSGGYRNSIDDLEGESGDEAYWLTLDGKLLYYFSPSNPGMLHRFNLDTTYVLC